MDNHNPIFEFETDFAGSLNCIPMCVRYTLDEIGIKLSLKQWNTFATTERRRLAEMSCGEPARTTAFTEYLTELITARAGSHVERVPAISTAQWDDAGHIPPRILTYAGSRGISLPSLEKWATLSPLQRFALFKLTRPNHDNDNFLPAMREFSLLERSE